MATEAVTCSTFGKPATTRVYWVPPDVKDGDPPAAETEQCDDCLPDLIGPWARAGNLEVLT